MFVVVFGVPMRCDEDLGMVKGRVDEAAAVVVVVVGEDDVGFVEFFSHGGLEIREMRKKNEWVLYETNGIYRQRGKGKKRRILNGVTQKAKVNESSNPF